MKNLNVARLLETLLLFTGLVLVDYYIWQNASTNLYQDYENWAFDREAGGQTVSVRDFIISELRLAPAPLRAANENPAALEIPPAPAPRQLEDNELIGRLEIPRVGVRGIVREGTDAATLERAVGHIPSTPLPWQSGNVAIAAHRDSFFRGLSKIRANDLITFDTLKGRYQYRVESTKIVSPDNVSVLAPSSDAELTLITCYPFYYVGSAPQRFIVHARRVDAAPDSTLTTEAALQTRPSRAHRKPAI